MKTPDFIIEIFLQPGEFYWGDSDTRIKTLLGSCVSVCIWHPHLLIGGMSHSLLPAKGSSGNEELSGRYIDESFEMFMAEITKANAKPQDFIVKLFGGGDMFKEIWKNAGPSVGERNIQMARSLIEKFGFNLKVEHVGGAGHRNIIFDLWSGDVWMKHAGN